MPSTSSLPAWKRLLFPLIYNRPVAAAMRAWLDRRNRHLENVIFVATTGRSGTLTLVDMFDALPDCVALHEPYPVMHDAILRAATYGETDRVARYYAVHKAVNIRRAAAGARHYLEANHLFIKSFIEQALQDFQQRVRVIHLVRDPLKVASSIYGLQDFPGTDEGNRWWLDYHAPSNLLPLADLLDADGEFSHDFYKCLWYWLETELRVEQWQRQRADVPFIHFRTEDLSDPARVGELLGQLGISAPEGFLETACQKRSHQRVHQKLAAPPDPHEQQRMLQRLLETVRERGLPLPATLDDYA